MRISKAQVRNTVFILIVLIGFTLFSANNTQPPVSYRIEANTLVLTGPKETPFKEVIPIREITSLALVTNPDPGIKHSGTETRKGVSGTWENDVYGIYTIHAFANVEPLIEIHTDQRVILCNYESWSATESLYAALLELVQTNYEESKEEEVTQ